MTGMGTYVSAAASDAPPLLAGTDPGATVLPPPTVSVPTVTWPRNAKGLTYGSELQATVTNQLPDLIAAIATNGKQGYVRRLDLYRPGPTTPSQAISQNATAARSIPVYAVDGTTVIVDFRTVPWGQAA